MQFRKTLMRISTGSTVIDNLLGGGIESQSITEIFGESAAGKTQFSHTLAVTSFAKNKGKTLYIDTENTFRSERIIDMAERFKLDPMEVLENIEVACAENTEKLLIIIKEVNFLLEKGGYNLLIIDSIMAPFRVDFMGRGELCLFLIS